MTKFRPRHRKGTGEPFNRSEINKRFLDLFPGESQASIGKLFNVNQPVVYKWHHNLLQVPWETLKYAVDMKNVTWEWLLEGKE